MVRFGSTECGHSIIIFILIGYVNGGSINHLLENNEN